MSVMNNVLLEIVQEFQIEGEIGAITPMGEGFINDTFIVKTKEENTPDYLLQRKNKQIFRDIPAMMQNILRVSNHLKIKIENQGGDPEREALTLVLSQEGVPYFIDHKEEFWTLCLFIKNSKVFQVADEPQLAYSGGKGIGKFQKMLADMKEPLTDILPGFHNIRYRFQQWDEVLQKNPVGRKEDLKEEISWIEERKAEMLSFWNLVEEGKIPARVTHNDTKISNILFDQKDEVLCVIDLDTVLNSTVLNDFGDAIRSYCNTAAEDEQDLQKIALNLELFEAFAKGYLEESKTFLSETELEYLSFSARYITYEQVLRFLMDYIDGDHYYKIKYKEHNLVRTRAQFQLLKSMEEQYEQMCEIVNKNLF